LTNGKVGVNFGRRILLSFHKSISTSTPIVSSTTELVPPESIKYRNMMKLLMNEVMSELALIPFMSLFPL